MTSSKKKATNYCTYGLVARYRPQTSCQRKWLNILKSEKMLQTILEFTCVVLQVPARQVKFSKAGIAWERKVSTISKLNLAQPVNRTSLAGPVRLKTFHVDKHRRWQSSCFIIVIPTFFVLTKAEGGQKSFLSAPQFPGLGDVVRLSDFTKDGES